MKTYLAAISIDFEEEEILIEANSPEQAIEKMFMTYGFDSDSIIIYHEIDREYAEMLGYDTY
jgi:hypothetical protein